MPEGSPREIPSTEKPKIRKPYVKKSTDREIETSTLQNITLPSGEILHLNDTITFKNTNKKNEQGESPEKTEVVKEIISEKDGATRIIFESGGWKLAKNLIGIKNLTLTEAHAGLKAVLNEADKKESEKKVKLPITASCGISF